MSRFLPLALIPLVAVSAWRRDTTIPDRGPHGSRIHAILAEEPAAVATETVTPQSPRQASAEPRERERRLQERIVALETALQEAQQEVEEYRAKLTKALNGTMEWRLRTNLEYSQQYAAQLEADLAIMETAYVELAARLRRSD